MCVCMCVYINLLKSVNAGIEIKKQTNPNVGCVCVYPVWLA